MACRGTLHFLSIMCVVITGTSGHFLADVSDVDKSLGVNLPVMQITAGGCYERHQVGWSGRSTHSEEAIFSPIYIARTIITTKHLLLFGSIAYCMLSLEIFIDITLCMVLKLGRFGQQIRNTWKVLKCGAGEGWRRSVGPIM